MMLTEKCRVCGCMVKQWAITCNVCNTINPHSINWKSISVKVGLLSTLALVISLFFLPPSQSKHLATTSSKDHANTTYKGDIEHGRKIINHYCYGYTDRSYMDKALSYQADQDQVAFDRVIQVGLRAGFCTLFAPNEFVFVVDTAILSGLVKIRREGDINEYWIPLEEIQ